MKILLYVIAIIAIISGLSLFIWISIKSKKNNKFVKSNKKGSTYNIILDLLGSIVNINGVDLNLRQININNLELIKYKKLEKYGFKIILNNSNVKISSDMINLNSFFIKLEKEILKKNLEEK
ncbi:hypothetical protein [Spiroplasma endosymbiont of Labia minor]|uniref:hypothetical protein n=1 Tax=Spiroplasma endosymbiont of Labia minor TaxID=3066305 RepID=UPI0030D1BFED